MKTLTISSKSKANAILIDSLFRPVNGRTLNKARYDLGKYAASNIGRAVEVSDTTYALWTERRTDSSGPYWALYCLTSN